jgi:hypothetical protein
MRHPVHLIAFLPSLYPSQARAEGIHERIDWFNNAAIEVIKEEEKQFHHPQDWSGRPAVVAFDGPTLLNGIERVAQELATQPFNVDAYLRLNVDRGMENTEMSNWDELGAIEGYTETYLAVTVVTKAIDPGLKRLQDRVGAITLGQLSTFAWPSQFLTCIYPDRSSVIRTQAKVYRPFSHTLWYWDAMQQYLVVSPR